MIYDIIRLVNIKVSSITDILSQLLQYR